MASVAGRGGEQSQRRKTVLAAIESYNEWSIDAIISHRSPTATHEILPKSLKYPTMDNTTYRSFFGAIMPYFRDFHVVVNDVIEDEKENKVAIWAKSTAVTDIGSYANEYMLVFYLDGKGEKIERMLEFVDSGVTVPYMTELGKYIKEKEGKNGSEKRNGKI